VDTQCNRAHIAIPETPLPTLEVEISEDMEEEWEAAVAVETQSSSIQA